MTAQEVRTAFLNYFKQQRHIVVPSSSLVPAGDPSVLLTTAGMQQFKPYFKDPTLADAEIGSRRAASVQKSFRTTDISEVGDTSHLTFFEMLGNFSFGDYFKAEAIEWAWRFMRDILKVSSERMHVTIFKGEGEVPRDETSAVIWQKLGVPASKIQEANRLNNFWGPTGEEGPCGPTTEIYVDGLEVWNIVFNEYYCLLGGRLEPLSQPGVDTGMGLERLLKVLSRMPSIYETDAFEPIIKVIANYETNTQTASPEPERGEQPVSDQERARRIIADHLKASCFLIVDGIRPSNVKQGYILRRLIRRAVRYERLLGLRDGWLPAIVASAIGVYQKAYPELIAGQTNIIKVIGEERAAFHKALGRGLKVFEQMLHNNPGSLTGAQAFRLYESFGFPFELVAELAQERSLCVSRAEFEAAAREHQTKSRAAAG